MQFAEEIKARSGIFALISTIIWFLVTSFVTTSHNRAALTRWET